MQAADQRLLKLILLALHLSFLQRCWTEVCWRVLAWQAATVAVFAADLLWSMQPRWRRAYLRWRDSIAAALRFTSFGLGLGADAVWRQVNAAPPPPPAPAAAAPWALALHAARLVFVSGAVPLIMGTLGLRTSLGLSALGQAGAVGSNLWRARAGCGGAFFSHPAVQAQTHALYRTLSLASAGLPLPLAPLAGPSDPVAECATVVSFLQVLAFVLPVLAEASSTAQLFAAHQREREAAGLPPERGACGAAYAAVCDLCGGGGTRLRLCMLAWPAVALAWDWPAFLHARASSPVV